jgi:hypothetical protein
MVLNEKALFPKSGGIKVNALDEESRSRILKRPFPQFIKCLLVLVLVVVPTLHVHIRLVLFEMTIFSMFGELLVNALDRKTGAAGSLKRRKSWSAKHPSIRSNVKGERDQKAANTSMSAENNRSLELQCSRTRQ